MHARNGVIGVLVVMALGGWTDVQNKPVHTARVDDAPLLYGSLSELCSASDLVATATAGPSQTRRLELRGKPDARLIVTMTVDDVVRQSLRHPVAGNTFEVELMAGRHDLDASVREYRGARVGGLVRGQRYLLFLKWSDYSKAFYFTSGPGSVYEVKGESLKALSGEELAQEFASRRTSEVLGALHSRTECAR